MNFLMNHLRKIHGKKYELAWRSGSVMVCHATARCSNPGGNGVFNELHVLRKVPFLNDLAVDGTLNTTKPNKNGKKLTPG